jgi:TolB-like protein/cytochrome c-type biogenesis protein CcmH/NrfG
LKNKPRKSLWSQLKKRKVIRVAISYILVAWVMMQVGEVTFEALTLPSWALTLFIVIILLGFPIAMVLAWAYEVTPEGIRRDSPADSDSTESVRPGDGQAAPSIAVLPFEDMSEQGDQRYFCEGIAEEILNALCKIANLRVAARIAAFQFSGQNIDVKDIGKSLKVQAVLEGSVRKYGDKLRITVQLVKTADGYHLWSRQFDRCLVDIFEIQEEIANAVANSLSVTLKRKSISARQPVDPRAYDFFLRGQNYFARQNQEGMEYARQMFRQALDIDPDFGRAWAGLAYTHGFDFMYFNATEANRDEALRSSKKALTLSPDLAESHVAAGMAHCMVKDYRMAEAEFETAIELDEKNFDAWYFFARDKVHEGDLERALKLFQRAARVRPEDFQSVLLQAQLFISLGDERRAIEVSRTGVERARALLELNPEDTRALNMGAFGLLRIGETEEAEAWMAASVARAPNDSIIHYNAACLYALSGKIKQSLDYLEACMYRIGALNRDWILHDSDLDNVREDPRFLKILADFPE